MAQEISVKLVRAREFESDLHRLTPKLIDEDTDELRLVGEGLVPKVRSLMPRVSGALGESVAARRVSTNEVDVTAGTPYAHWIEFGGSRGRPLVATGRFLTPTVAGSGGTVKARVTSRTSKTIGGFRWSHTS